MVAAIRQARLDYLPCILSNFILLKLDSREFQARLYAKWDWFYPALDDELRLVKAGLYDLVIALEFQKLRKRS